MNKLIIIFAVSMIFPTCKIKGQLEIQKKTINEFVTAAKKNDIDKLYELIDTVTLFKIQDKEGFVDQISYINRRLKTCDDKIQNLTILDGENHTKVYLCEFCREKGKKNNNNSFDIRFTFFEYGEINRIKFIDLIKYKEINIPTKPIY